jgi:hypothetical protein
LQSLTECLDRSRQQPTELKIQRRRKSMPNQLTINERAHEVLMEFFRERKISILKELNNAHEPMLSAGLHESSESDSLFDSDTDVNVDADAVFAKKGN